MDYTVVMFCIQLENVFQMLQTDILPISTDLCWYSVITICLEAGISIVLAIAI